MGVRVNANWITFEDFLTKYSELTIPEYQRPYTWSQKSAVQLYDDIILAYEKKSEYRIGNFIIHSVKNGDQDKVNIVDGQQRITTLLLICYILVKKSIEKNKDDEKSKLISTIINNIKFKPNSFYNIKNTFDRLNDVIVDDQASNILDFIFDKCEVICININDPNNENLGTAFQLFDSQNDRGKSLEPHDILKSYHLRQWALDTENNKKEILEDWNKMINGTYNCGQENDYNLNLKDLFKKYLYKIIRWVNFEDGLDYDKDKIDVFKGFNGNSKNEYNYEKYFNNMVNTNYYLLTGIMNDGKYFFEYILHYYIMLKNIMNHNKYVIYKLGWGPGDIATKELFECAMMLLIDRFDEESILKNEAIVKTIQKWALSLRFNKKSMGEVATNKYALGNEGFNKYNLFNIISRMTNVNSVCRIEFDYIGKPEKDTYNDIYKEIYGVNDNDK